MTLEIFTSWAGTFIARAAVSSTDCQLSAVWYPGAYLIAPTGVLLGQVVLD